MAQNNALQVRQKAVTDLLAANMKQVKSVLPKHLTPERMLRIANNAIKGNQKLMQCTPASLINSIVEASVLGLEIGGALGYAHLVPYKTNATLIIGYRGFMDLAYRSGRVKNFQAHAVYENDEFDFEYGTESFLIHKPCRTGDRGGLIAAYAVAKFENGNDFEVILPADAEYIKGKSAAKFKKDSPWNTDDVWAMWVKTAIRRLAKRLPLSPEIQRAAVVDELAESVAGQNLEHIVDVEFSDPVNITDKIKASIDPSDEPLPTTTPAPKPEHHAIKRLRDSDEYTELMDGKYIAPEQFAEIAGDQVFKTKAEIADASKRIKALFNLAQAGAK